MDIEKELQEAISQHYDQEYFNWQKNIGAFGGSANSSKFFEICR